MNVLGLDAALGSFSAAWVENGRARCTIERPGGVALEQGLKALADMLASGGVGRAAVDRLGVGIGPGGFTGVRIAISYAKSLALGWGVPLVGVNSFDAIERDELPGPALCVVRGRQGVVSVRFRRDGREVRASGYVADVLERLGPASGTLRVIGDAQDVLGGLAERGWAVIPVERPTVPAALAVALIAAQREPARSLHEVRADYGELPAVNPPKPQKRARRESP